MNSENDMRRSTSFVQRRRPKVQLSCNLCRKRNFVQHNGSSEVTPPPQAHSSTYQRLQTRINALETLAASVLENQPANESPPGEHPEASGAHISCALSAKGTERDVPIDQSQTGTEGENENERASRLGSDHWIAILDGIGELRSSLQHTQLGIEHDAAPSNLLHLSGAELLLGCGVHVTREAILGAIPPRETVDRLVSSFFRSVDTAPMVIHSQTFLKEYQNFWDHRNDVSIIWIGLLFVVICLALLHQRSGFAVQDIPMNGDLWELWQGYRARAAQCLTLGNYSKPAPYVVETLLLYMHVEILQSKDSETGLWVLLGITVRLALRMGYHRDGSHFSHISPFQAEMRRRNWCALSIMDAGAAEQYGLPRMIQLSQSDTAEPSNVLEENIYEGMLELPSTTPESIQSPVQYFVAKSKLIEVACKILDLNSRIRIPEYAEILKLDMLLEDIYQSVPPHLAMRTMTESILADTKIIIQRMYLNLTFYKAKCMLHRRYLILAKTDERYRYSRTTGIGALLEILRLQQIVDQETEPDGRLHAERGRITSQMRSTFLLAISILCIDLDHCISNGSSLSSSSRLGSGECETIISALRTVHGIWQRWSYSSQEAQQALHVLDVVLKKVAAATASPSSSLERVSIHASAVQGSLSTQENTQISPPTTLPFLHLSSGSYDMSLGACQVEDIDPTTHWMSGGHEGRPVAGMPDFAWIFPGDWSTE